MYLRKIIIPWFKSCNLLGNVGGEGEGLSAETLWSKNVFFFFLRDAHLGWRDGGGGGLVEIIGDSCHS